MPTAESARKSPSYQAYNDLHISSTRKQLHQFNLVLLHAASLRIDMVTYRRRPTFSAPGMDTAPINGDPTRAHIAGPRGW